MRRRITGLAKRFIRSILKDSLLQNFKNDAGQHKASFSTVPFRLSNVSANSFMKSPELKNVYGNNTENLLTPSSYVGKPILSYFYNKNKEQTTQNLNSFQKSQSLNYSHGGGQCGHGCSGGGGGHGHGGQTKECLLTKLQDKSCEGKKVTVVGAGSVGVACAFTILAQRITNNICLIDAMKNKLEGEAMDIQHGSTFFSNLHVEHSTSYEITQGSSVCIITAGARQKEGESRLSLVGRNVAIMKAIIPNLVKHSPDSVILVASNPCDIMTYLSWKLSGLPRGRVVGTGTNLDSSRFRFYVSQRLGVAPSSVHGWIVGEHGDSSVAIWSSVNVAGVRLAELNPKMGHEDDPEHWHEVHKLVITSAGDVIKLKGYTNWAIAMSAASLTNTILGNLGAVHAVSVPVKGFHDIHEDVYMSLPASLGINGVNDIVKQHLAENEKCALQKSAEVLFNLQKDIKL